MAIMAVRAARAVLVVLALDTGGEQEDRGPSAVNVASVEDNMSLGLIVFVQHVLFSSKQYFILW